MAGPRAPAAYVAEDGLVGHQREEKPLELIGFFYPAQHYIPMIGYMFFRPGPKSPCCGYLPHYNSKPLLLTITVTNLFVHRDFELVPN